MEIFRQLGRDVEARWRSSNYDERRFPALATEVLEHSDLLDEFETLDVLRWIACEPALPEQLDPSSEFSDLALSLYSTPRFSVSVLVWMDGSTAIHEHSFSGAFRVLAGSSLHSRYRFQEERRVNGRFRLGRLELDGVDLLATGSVHSIEGHSGFIHSLFHLERPSVSLVVRTGHEPRTGPQWSYFSPGIAIDPFFRDTVAIKKLEAVRVLSALDPETADPVLARMLEAADLQLTYRLLTALFHQLEGDPLKRFAGVPSSARFDGLVEVSRQRHGDVVDRFLESAEEEQRQGEIIRMRGAFTQPDHRFLLALLLNVQKRETALELLAKRYPDRDPVEELVDRIQDLATTRQLGSSAPNVLGIPDFDVEHRTVLRRLLRGGSSEDAADDLIGQLNEDPAGARKLATEIAASLREATLLRALLRAGERSRAELLAELRAARRRAERAADRVQVPEGTEAASGEPAKPSKLLESGREAPAHRPPLKILLGIQDSVYFRWQLPILCESLVGQLPKGWELVAVVCNGHAPISVQLSEVFETYGVRLILGADHPGDQDIDFASGGENYLPFNRIEALAAAAESLEDDDLVLLMDADNFLYRDLDISIFPRGDAVCKNWMIAEELFFEHRPEPGGVDLRKLLESIGCSGDFERGGVAVFLRGRTVRNEKFVRDCFRFTQVVYLLGRIAGFEHVWWAEMPCFTLALAANGVETKLIGAESFVITKPESIAPGSFYHYYGDVVDDEHGFGAFRGSSWGKQSYFERDLLQADLDSAHSAAVTDHERCFFELAKRARARLAR